LLDLLHDELLLVDLDDDGGVSCVAPGEAELAEGRLEFLRDVDGAALHVVSVNEHHCGAVLRRLTMVRLLLGGWRWKVRLRGAVALWYIDKIRS
jgi:hypothetical protein